MKVESSRRQLLVSKPSRSCLYQSQGISVEIGILVADSARIQRSVSHRLFIPDDGCFELVWQLVAYALYGSASRFRVWRFRASTMPYLYNELSTSLPTFPVHKSPLFNRLPAQARHGMRCNLTLTLKFVGVPCLQSLPAGI